MEAKLFIDTMVFLHFRPLDELNLRKLTDSESITLVIPRITLQELDEHKNTHKSNKVRDRARTILALLEEAISKSLPLKGKIAVEFLADYPEKQLEEWHLNNSSADDVLLACSIACQERCEEAKVIVVTDDTGLRLACRHCGVTALALDKSLALSDDLSELERENRQLRTQILRLENAMPKFEVVFSDSEEKSNAAKFELSPHPPIDEQSLASRLAKLRESYPKKSAPGTVPSNHPLAKIENSALKALAEMDPNSIRPEEYTRYNRELDQYFKEAESYYRRLHSLLEPMSRTINFTIEIRNTGTAPAEDVDVLVHFPDGFRLMSENDLPEVPDFPEPPLEPLSPTGELSRRMAHAHSLMHFRPNLPQFSQTSSFKIEETNSFKVSDHFHRIKHGFPTRLPKMYIEFPSLSDAFSFNCTYELRPANLADPKVGELHFVIAVTNA